MSVEAEPVLEIPPESSLGTKETERQLSKKELKKKGLEELEAVLAELGYAPREPSSQDDSHGNATLLITYKSVFNTLVLSNAI